MENQQKVKNLIELRAQAKLGGGEKELHHNMRKVNSQLVNDLKCC